MEDKKDGDSGTGNGDNKQDAAEQDPKQSKGNDASTSKQKTTGDKSGDAVMEEKEMAQEDDGQLDDDVSFDSEEDDLFGMEPSEQGRVVFDVPIQIVNKGGPTAAGDKLAGATKEGVLHEDLLGAEAGAWTQRPMIVWQDAHDVDVVSCPPRPHPVSEADGSTGQVALVSAEAEARVAVSLVGGRGEAAAGSEADAAVGLI